MTRYYVLVDGELTLVSYAEWSKWEASQLQELRAGIQVFGGEPDNYARTLEALDDHERAKTEALKMRKWWRRLWRAVRPRRRENRREMPGRTIGRGIIDLTLRRQRRRN